MSAEEGPCEVTAMRRLCTPGREASPGTFLAGPLAGILVSSELCKPPSLQYLGVAAELADSPLLSPERTSGWGVLG